MGEGAGCLELKSRVWGLVLPRCLPLEGRRDARPGDGARTPSPTGAVRRQPAVSGLGLDDDGPLPCMLVLRCEGRAWPSPTSTRLGTGGELHTTELLRRERWPGERVVVLGRKQVPAEHGELAGDGHRGDVAPAASCHALTEGAHGSGASSAQPRPPPPGRVAPVPIPPWRCVRDGARRCRTGAPWA